jgi:hypothetical protein
MVVATAAHLNLMRNAPHDRPNVWKGMAASARTAARAAPGNAKAKARAKVNAGECVMARVQGPALETAR